MDVPFLKLMRLLGWAWKSPSPSPSPSLAVVDEIIHMARGFEKASAHEHISTSQPVPDSRERLNVHFHLTRSPTAHQSLEPNSSPVIPTLGQLAQPCLRYFD